MVSILPSERSPLDLILKQVGQSLSQTLPGAIEGYQNRGRLQQAANQFNPQGDVYEQVKNMAHVLSTPGGSELLKTLMQTSQNESSRTMFDHLFNNGNVPQGQPNQQPNQFNQQGSQPNYQQQGSPLQGNEPKPRNVRNDPSTWDDALINKLRSYKGKDPNLQTLSSLADNEYEGRKENAKSNIETLSNEKYSAGVDAIENSDNKALNTIIKDPAVPYTVKQKLMSYKTQHDLRSDVRDREVRTKLSNINSAYTKAINKEKDLLSKATFKNTNAIEKRIEDLEQKKKEDMKRFRKDPNSYLELEIWGNEASKHLPEDEIPESNLEGEEEFDEDFAAEGNRDQKVLFNPKNPKHMARLKEIYQKVGGDKARANEILFKEFNK